MREFDVIVVGGGIHGAGVLQAAVAAGHRALLIEQQGDRERHLEPLEQIDPWRLALPRIRANSRWCARACGNARSICASPRASSSSSRSSSPSTKTRGGGHGN
jgi:hypothetical protein